MLTEAGKHIKDALFNLASYKLRSSLAVIGILVGTASVVAMVLCAQLATEKALAQFKPLGTNLMSIVFYPRSRYNEAVNELTPEQALMMDQLHDGIKQVAIYDTFHKKTYYHDTKIKGRLMGTNAAFADILNLQLAQGRFISDLDQHSRYLVIGDDIAQQLKKEGLFNPVGTQIRVSSEYYTIIGVLKKRTSNGFFYEDINRMMITPLQTALSIKSSHTINNIMFNLAEGADFKKIESLTKAYLQRHSENHEVYIRSAEEIVEQMKSQSRIFTLLLGLIGSISLLVGGIGVMNIMLVSVTERRQEIGIRKAIGARISDIYGLFLTESMIISFLGGAIGVLFGLVISYFIAKYAQWVFAIHWTPPIVGFAVSVAIGVFFGFYPAYKAANLAPIDALRS